MITLSSKGDWKRTFNFLQRAKDMQVQQILERYGQKGVDALAANTPKRTGFTASCWTYEVVKTGNGWGLNWINTNTNKGVNIAFILQAGHGTGTGGYVAGIDYINPAMHPIFDEIADQAFREVTSL